MCGFEETELENEKVLLLNSTNEKMKLYEEVVHIIEDLAPEQRELQFEAKRAYVPPTQSKQAQIRKIANEKQDMKKVLKEA